MVLTTVVAALLLFLNSVFELIDAIRLWPKGCDGFSSAYHSNNKYESFFLFNSDKATSRYYPGQTEKLLTPKGRQMKNNLEINLTAGFTVYL